MTIGGNTQAILQVKAKGAKNRIGAYEPTWVYCATVLGWLDLSAGDSKHTVFSAKVQESTHIFLCDHAVFPTNFTDEQGTVKITSENTRLVIQGLVYEILLIDNPMNMNEHLEIYLKFIGGQ